MRLKKDFITHSVGGQSTLVPLGGAQFSGLVKGNKTLGVILELLKTDTTEDKIVAAMTERFDASQEVIARDVHRALTELRRIDALDE